MIDFIQRYREQVERMIQAVLATAGDTDRSLRRAVEVRAATLGGLGSASPPETLSPPIDRYVAQVALHAYKVTDADVETLKELGYSEDAIFEITLSAAMGAALGRLDRGLGVLRGDRP